MNSPTQEQLIEKLAKADELRLHLGEMTAQEMRTAKATVRYVVAKLADSLAQPARVDALHVRLAEVLRDCAADLECEINNRFPHDVRKYPNEERRYQSDMGIIHGAELALAAFDAARKGEQS